MINKFGNFIEIKPMVHMGGVNEILSIDLSDRKIVAVHVHGPRSPKHAKVLKSMISMYGNHMNMMSSFIVMEIVTSPDSTKSASMKTLEHEVIYTNSQDYQTDYSKIRCHVYEGVPL